MRKLFTFLAVLLLTASVFAQSPEKMSYQAVIRNSNDELVTNTPIGMQISILQGSVSGTAVYVETQTPTTNANGLASIEIGGGEGFSSIDWSAGPYFIKTETDPGGGTNYSITGSSELLSVPFALNAKASEHIMVAVSATGDTLYIGSEQWVIVPGISEANPQSGTSVIDADGNVYQTVTIGTQEWLAENLKTTKFKDGTAIPLVTDNAAWHSLKTPGYCWSNNDQTTYGNTYGALYNFYTVSTGDLCPNGWHVPTDAEWTELVDYLGGEAIAGGKLKETGTTHWNEPNTGATNESGFTALPGGDRWDNGEFSDDGYLGYWWSATETDIDFARYRGMASYYGDAVNFNYRKYIGVSVRCVKD